MTRKDIMFLQKETAIQSFRLQQTNSNCSDIISQRYNRTQRNPSSACQKWISRRICMHLLCHSLRLRLFQHNSVELAFL